MPNVTPPPRNTLVAITCVLITVIVVVGALVFSGRDISAVAGFLLAIIPSTLSSVIAVGQNDRLIADSQTIKANVNGNLSKLIELAGNAAAGEGAGKHSTPPPSTPATEETPNAN